MTRRELIRAAIVVGALLALCVLLAPCGFPIAPVQLAFYIVAGWIKFLLRTAPEIAVDWASVAMAAVVFAIFVVGLHALLRSLWRAKCAHWPFRRSLAAALLMATLFTAGMATVGLAHQFAWMVSDSAPILDSGRGGSRRARSQNNLRQFGVAIENYHARRESFPPGGTRDEQGRMLHGWQTLILPELEQQALYDKIDLQQPWNSPRNRHVFRYESPLFLIPQRHDAPTHDGAGYGLTHYCGNVLVLSGDRARSKRDLPDGASNTLLIGEALENPKPWGFPANWRDPRAGINASSDGFGGPYRGAHFTFADASVRLLSDDIDPKVLAALATPAGDDGAVLESWDE